MQDLIDWAVGPAFRFAAAVFVLGLLRHVGLTLLAVRVARRRAGDRSLPMASIRRATWSWLFPARRLSHHPGFTLASVVFHIGVILTPLFLAGHVLLIERAIGLSWPVLPAMVADILTIVALAGIAVLAGVRLFARTPAKLSRSGDIVLLFVVGLPLLSGFLVMHPGLHPIPFAPLFLVHVLSANLLLAAAPFTKLVHLALLPATQLVSEVGWKFPADGGERVATALGKENQPI